MLKKIDHYDGKEFFDFYFAGECVGKFYINWDTDEPSIWNVEIVEKYRGMGLGEQMMKECVEFLKKDSAPKTVVYLYVYPRNIPAVKIYEKAGFVHTGIIRNHGPERMEILL